MLLCPERAVERAKTLKEEAARLKKVAEKSAAAAAEAASERDHLAESLHELSVQHGSAGEAGASGSLLSEQLWFSAVTPLSSAVTLGQPESRSVREELERSHRAEAEARAEAMETELEEMRVSMERREERFASEKRQALEAAGTRVRSAYIIDQSISHVIRSH